MFHFHVAHHAARLNRILDGCPHQSMHAGLAMSVASLDCARYQIEFGVKCWGRWRVKPKLPPQLFLQVNDRVFCCATLLQLHVVICWHVLYAVCAMLCSCRISSKMWRRAGFRPWSQGGGCFKWQVVKTRFAFGACSLLYPLDNPY